MTVYTDELPTDVVIERGGVVFIGVEENEGSVVHSGQHDGTEERRNFDSSPGE